MVPDEITTLDEAVDAFNMAKDAESDAQFEQSDIAARACIESNRKAWGMSNDDILKHVGSQTDTSRTTMYGRLLVGQVFPEHWREADENAWCQVKRWSHFEVCARQWSEDDPEAPIEWLKYCVDNDLSVRRLKSEIALANGGPPSQERPIYLLDAAPCTVTDVSAGGVSLHFETYVPEWRDMVGERVVVTIVKEPETPQIPV